MKVKKYEFFKFLVYFFGYLNDRQRYKVCEFILMLKMKEYGLDDIYIDYFVAHPQKFIELTKDMLSKSI